MTTKTADTQCGTQRRITSRRISQLALLALFVYLLARTRWPLSESFLVNAFLSLDPLLSLQALIAGRAWVPASIYGAALLVATLILGRFFCGWICPMGTLLELGDDAVFGKKRRLWKNADRRLRGIKYGVLLVIVVAAVFGHGLAYLADPICWTTRLFTYAVWPVGASLAHLILGATRPVFESLGWMGLARTQWAPPVFGLFGVIALLFFVVVIALGRWQRRLWCRSFCPLGALLAIPARFTIFHRRVSSACTAEGLCARSCETGAIGDDFTKYDPAECVQCGACATVCHVGAVDFAPRDRQASEPRVDLTRRHAAVWASAAVVASSWLKYEPRRREPDDGALRPPGAMPEDSFLATCVRCGQCVKACPTHALQSSAFLTGVSGLMSPVAKMRLGPCDQNCNVCGAVCPTGAIRSLDLEEKAYAKIGNAVIETGRCVVWEQNRVCLVCDENCPYGAIDWEETATGKRLPHVAEDRCNGCGACEHACPVEGVAAIRVRPAGQVRMAEGSYIAEAKDRGLDLRVRERFGTDAYPEI